MEFLNPAKFISFLAKKHFYFLFLFIGLLIFCFPMLKSNFDLMPDNGYNFLYNVFVLEHGFLWINKIAAHFSFWSAPVYYSSDYSLAYADSLIGFIPLYYFLRIFIKNPLNAYQALFILLCILNFSVFYYFLKRLRFNELSSSTGAYIFAFNIFRSFDIGEISSLSQFFSILAIIFLTYVNKNNSPIKNHLFFLFAVIFLVFQFYTSFSIGFFSVFMGFIAFLLSFLPKSARDCVTSFLKNHRQLLIFYIFVFASMLLPMAYYHSLTGQITTVQSLLGTIFDRSIWIRNLSFIDTIFYKNFDYVNFNQAAVSSCSPGVFSMFFGILGLINLKKKKGVLIMLLIVIFALSSGFIAISLYKALYLFLIGSEGLDSVNEIGYIALILIALGIAQFVKICDKRIIVFIIVLIVLETIPRLEDINSPLKIWAFSKTKFEEEISEVIKKIPSGTDVFELKYDSLNEEKFHKKDIEIKKIKAQNKIDMMAFYVTLKTKYKTKNRFWKIEKENDFKDAPAIIQTVDFKQI